MDYKICYYCGTKYPKTDERCPLCGQTETEPDPEETVKKAAPAAAAAAAPVAAETPRRSRTAKEEEKPVKTKGGNIFFTVVCILLAIAVIIGALFILRSLGLFKGKEPTEPGQTTELPTQPGTPEVDPNVIACTGLSVTPVNMSFSEAGQKTILTIKVEPSDCTEPVTLSVGDPAVATISAYGEVEAVANGTTVVTVACGKYTKTANIICNFLSTPTEPTTPGTTTEPTTPGTTTEPTTPGTTDPGVTPPTPATITPKISLEDFTLFSVGDSWPVTVSGVPAGQSVVWSSDDTAVCTVSETGRVTAVAPGTTWIHATVGTTVLDCIVRCNFSNTPSTPSTPAEPGTTTADPLEYDPSIDISHDDVSIYVTKKSDGSYSYESFTIFLYSGSERLTGTAWTSADESIATVTEKGVVTAVKAGTTTVQGVREGQTFKCIVRVFDN